MRSDWREVSVSDIAEDVAMGPFGSNIPVSCFVAAGVPVISGRHLHESRLTEVEFNYVTVEKADELRRSNVRRGDVVFTHAGTIGQVSIVPNDSRYERYVMSQRQFKLSVQRTEAVPEFIAYFFKSEVGQRELFKFANQTGVPSLARPVTNLRNVRLSLPPLRDQALIAAMLASMDDRIDLLRQTNATLESIAQALFKSWFIDFDPVHAKAEGREPGGMDAATAALFPAEFEESALGLIPKGWQARRIEELAEKVAMGPFGSNIKVSTFVDSGVPVVSGQHLRGVLLEDREFNFITEEHAKRLSGSLVKPGDIVLTHAGNIGQVALIPRDAAYQKYVLSQRQFYLRCNLDVASPEHLAYFLRSSEGQHVLLANASQVGVPSIARPASYLKSIQLVAPPVSIARAFADVVSAVHFSISSARRRSALLQHVRDALLPRLISGKLRLPEAQAQLEEAIA